MKRETKRRFGHSSIFFFFSDVPNSSGNSQESTDKGNKDTNVDSVHYNSGKGGFVNVSTG